MGRGNSVFRFLPHRQNKKRKKKLRKTTETKMEKSDLAFGGRPPLALRLGGRPRLFVSSSPSDF
ncbi:hypothetical protein BpHYR1_017442 [Brachionus plicatilis]|uniref:Uncharacterized protein n=1 Tax=Brachionus plicatilis TaxID=10195 RepID=A0A3M7R323_BRAPC|nr:hypothetical protein BpHYR1_017442 [Brachionus plicatilis]